MKKYKSFNKAGKALGLTHRTVSLKCKKYNIDVKIIKKKHLETSTSPSVFLLVRV